MADNAKSPLVHGLLLSAALLLGAHAPALAQQSSAPSFGVRSDAEATPATYLAPSITPPGALQSPAAAPEPRLLTLPTPAAPVAVSPVAVAPVAEPVAAVGLTPADAKAPKKLALPGADRAGANKSGADKANAANSGTDSNAMRSTTSRGLSGVVTVLASLGVVLGLFIGMAWLMRRGLPKQGRLLPREAVESLGRIPFPGRQQGQLLRVGNKMVLVSFSNSGADVIAEITDPLEVDRLSGLCAQHDPHSSVKTFRDVVDQFFGEKPQRRAAARSAAAMRTKERDVV
ncbi:MAG: hypothetical protein K8U03_21920 [Planctomycetia bacterium]|nr:hypothetical protein [Planctomycetia bacterium]